MDMRILTTFPNHRKTRRLIKILGFEAFYSLVCLWAYVADNHPKGNLNGYDEIEIEESAKWTGKSGEFIKAILDEKTCFLLKTDNGYALRNWSKHQGWLINAPERRNKAKAAAEARWVGKKEDNSNATSNAPSIPTSNATSNTKSEVEQCPSPSPSPSPSPNPLILLSPSALSSVEEKPLIEKEAPEKKKRKTRNNVVDEEFIAEMKNLFPKKDVDAEIVKMKAWLLCNPGRQYNRRFFSNWITRAAETVGSSPALSQLEELQRRFGH